MSTADMEPKVEFGELPAARAGRASGARWVPVADGEGSVAASPTVPGTVGDAGPGGPT